MNDNVKVLTTLTGFEVTTKIFISKEIITTAIENAGIRVDNGRYNKVEAINILRNKYEGLSRREVEEIVEYVLENEFHEEPFKIWLQHA